MSPRLYRTLAAVVEKLGRPGVNSPDGIKRHFLRLGPFTACLSDYGGDARRPHGGEALAIYESLWIFSRRHARGLGVIRPWARTMNIDIDLAGARFSTEDGSLDLHPPILIPEPGRIRIHNTGQHARATANILVYLQPAAWARPAVIYAGQKTGSDNTVALQQPCAVIVVHALAPNHSTTVDVSECVARDQAGTATGVFVGAVRYSVEPDVTTPKTIGRLFGRPEWEA